MKKRYIIIGGSAAGMSAAKKVAELDKEAEVVCISKETCCTYNKCKLAKLLSGRISTDDLCVFSAQEAQGDSIDARLGVTVQKILSDNKSVMLTTGEQLAYDKLFIATGSLPITPLVAGVERFSQKSGLFHFHTLADVNAMLNFIEIEKPKTAVVVGAGMTGLECAGALSRLGIKVFVVERAEQLLPGCIDKVGSQKLIDRMNTQGVTFCAREELIEILGNENISEVALRSGKVLPADMLVFAVGVRPNVQLAQNAEIDVCEQGIIVDEYMQTSKEDIYAGGDVIAVKDAISGKTVRSYLWPDACMQGIVAAHAMVGHPRPYPGIYPVAVSKLWDMLVAFCGPVSDASRGYQEIVQQGADFYKKILLQDGFVRGFLLMGDISDIGILKNCIVNGQKLDSI